MTPARAYWLFVCILLIAACLFAWTRIQEASQGTSEPVPELKIESAPKEPDPFPIELLSARARSYLNSANQEAAGILTRPDPLTSLPPSELRSLATYYTSLNGEKNPGWSLAQQHLFKQWGARAPQEASHFCREYYLTWRNHPTRRSVATTMLSATYAGWTKIDVASALASWDREYADLPSEKIVPGKVLQLHDHVLHSIITSWSSTEPKSAWKHIRANLRTISAHALEGFFHHMHPETPWEEIAEAFIDPIGKRLRPNAHLFGKEWTAYHESYPLIWLLQDHVEITGHILKKYYRPNDEIIDETWLRDHWPSLGQQTRVHTLSLVLRGKESSP